jgi:hypothetical protein
MYIGSYGLPGGCKLDILAVFVEFCYFCTYILSYILYDFMMSLVCG